MEKYCKSCGRVFKNSDFKLCPYCGSSLSTREGRQPIPRKLRHRVFQRDGYRCRECGATNKQTRLHVDHIKPVAKGGTNDLSNLQTLCEACNRAKYTDEWVGGATYELPFNRTHKMCPNCLKWMDNKLTKCPYCGSNYSDGYVGGVNLNNSQKIKQDNNDFLTVVNEFKKSKPSTFYLIILNIIIWGSIFIYMAF